MIFIIDFLKLTLSLLLYNNIIDNDNDNDDDTDNDTDNDNDLGINFDLIYPSHRPYRFLPY